MSYELVHTFGSSIYFVFALLFLWIRTIPRTNPGAGWWALSISSALAARIALFVLSSADEAPGYLATAYVALNVLEKPLLVTGMIRFLNLDMRIRTFWVAGLIAEVWLIAAWLLDFNPIVRASGYSLINAILLASVGWFAMLRYGDYPKQPLRITAVSSFMLALHWLTAPTLVYLYPPYYQTSFVIGTVLVLVQYLSLLIATLTLVQKRLIAAEAKAMDLAFQDPLTGLNNKRYMTTLFDQALLLATRPHHVVAVFYIDLDNFKPINDSAGHSVGDEVLKVVAARLKERTRSTDICARVGGDEFVVIGTQLLNDEQSLEIGNKLLEKVVEGIEVGGRTYYLGASIGIALYPKHGRNLAELTKCADAAMYEVKRSGKSRCQLYGAKAE